MVKLPRAVLFLLSLFVMGYLGSLAAYPAVAQWAEPSGAPPGSYRPVLDSKNVPDFQQITGVLVVGSETGARTELDAGKVKLIESGGGGGALSSVAGNLLLAPLGGGSVIMRTASVVLPVIPSLQELNAIVTKGTARAKGGPEGLLVYYRPEQELKYFDGFEWWGISNAPKNPTPYSVKLVLRKNLPLNKNTNSSYPIPGIEIHTPFRGVWNGTGGREFLVPVGSTVKLWARNAKDLGYGTCRIFQEWEGGPCGAGGSRSTGAIRGTQDPKNRLCEFFVEPLQTDNPLTGNVRSTGTIEITGRWDNVENELTSCTDGETSLPPL